MRTGTGFSSDILQPILLEEWPMLQQQLKDDWPRYAFYYYWIQNSTKWKKLDPDLALQIYCPHGQYRDDATFVGISNSSIWSVVVFTREPTGEKLREAIIHTKRIDWSQKITLPGVHEYIQPILFPVLDTLRTNREIEIDQDIPGCYWIKSADECADVEVKIPEECYLGELNVSHLPIIHSVWPHADMEQPENSLKFLQPCVTLNKSFGLFLKEGDVLVSWGLHNDWHALGLVQTLEAYKRRGYAKVIVNVLAKQLGKEGISPMLCIVRGNIPSENMFASLNWKRTVSSRWIVTRKPLCEN